MFFILSLYQQGAPRRERYFCVSQGAGFQTLKLLPQGEKKKGGKGSENQKKRHFFRKAQQFSMRVQPNV